MLLWMLILLPAIAGGLCYLIPSDDERIVKMFGILVAVATIVLAVVTRNAEVSARWLSRPFEANFHFGATPISFWIVLLLTISTASAVLATKGPRQRGLIALLLLLEASMLAVFLARDLLVFALGWDLMLIPVFFCLVQWSEHAQTAWRYFLYNFAGGLTLLLATAAFGMHVGTTDVIGRSDVHVIGSWAPWILAGFAFAFLVKTPVWPLHTWMPATYTDLPPPMVAVVSAVQSKAGLYGFIAIGMAFLPDYMKQYAGIFIVLGAISLLYGALVALMQTDAKRVVAYSSLSHLGLIVVAVFAFNAVALQGAVVYIVAHGLFSAAIFLLLGYVEEREATRSLLQLGGLGADNPRLAGALCIAALAALGLPGLAGFVGEIVIVTGIFQAGMVWPAIVALVAIVLAAAYVVRLFQGLMNGPGVPDLPVRRDLTWIEGLAVAPLLAALVVVGIDPKPLLSFDTSAYAVSAHGAPVASARISR
ncbi:MAG TPA: NADH-quinone oxidoreductase subunit M [Verrucomicrobiae bacterium]|jgi:NADH-quinone oxidoreductase subunit M|nr:NADH-quinone oxidoreductase subunit M [Verrucomicrobiae bacterium]